MTGRLAAVGLGALASVESARALGPAGWGLCVVVVSVVTVAATLGRLSVDVAHISLWPQVEDKRAFASNAVVLGALLGGCAAAVAWTFVVLAGDQVVPRSAHGVLAAALLLVPVSVTLVYANNLLLLQDRIGRMSLALVGGAMAQAIVVSTLFFSGALTIRWALVAWSMTVTVPVGVALLSLRARLHRFEPRLAYRTVRMGLRYHLGSASQFLLFRIDVLILSAMTNRASVGLYSVAVAVAEMTFLVCGVVAQVALPRQVVGTNEARAEFTAKVIRLNGLCSAGTVVALAAASPVVIPLLYGQPYRASVGALVALLPGVMAMAALNSVGPYMVSLDRPYVISGLNVAAVLLNVGANLVLIPRFGVVGASVASSVAYFLFALAELAWFSRETGIGWKRLVPGRDDVALIVRNMRRLVGSPAMTP